MTARRRTRSGASSTLARRTSGSRPEMAMLVTSPMMPRGLPPGASTAVPVAEESAGQQLPVKWLAVHQANRRVEDLGSARSELTTVARCRRAASTTDASTTSLVPALPHRTPAARAPASVSDSTTTSRALSSRANRACRPPPLHTWPTTPAGTTTSRCSWRAAPMTAAGTVVQLPRNQRPGVQDQAQRCSASANRRRACASSCSVSGPPVSSNSSPRTTARSSPWSWPSGAVQPGAHRLGLSFRDVLVSPLRNCRVEPNTHLADSHTVASPGSRGAEMPPGSGWSSGTASRSAFAAEGDRDRSAEARSPRGKRSAGHRWLR